MKIGKPLAIPSRPTKTFDVTFENEAGRPSTISHFDRNGDGKVDALLISKDHLNQTDTLVLLDSKQRMVEQQHAVNGVVVSEGKIEWESETTGRRTGTWDANHDGVADHRRSVDVSITPSSPLVLRYSELIQHKGAVITNHDNKNTTLEKDLNQDGQWEKS